MVEETCGHSFSPVGVCVVPTCGCIAYSEQVNDHSQMGFNIWITHGPLERVAGDAFVESHVAKLLRVCSHVGAMHTQGKFRMLITRNPFGKGRG